MDLKTIIAAAPFLRRLYKKLPRPLRIFGLVLAVIAGVVKLVRGRREEAAPEGDGGAGAQAGRQSGTGG